MDIGDCVTTQLELSIAAGKAGIERVASKNLAFLAEVRELAVQLCRQRGTVTIDDVRENTIWKPSHPNAWGAVFKSSEFEFIRMEPCRHIAGHGRWVRVWRLKNA